MPTVNPPAMSCGRSSRTLYFGSQLKIGNQDFMMLTTDHLAGQQFRLRVEEKEGPFSSETPLG